MQNSLSVCLGTAPINTPGAKKHNFSVNQSKYCGIRNDEMFGLFPYCDVTTGICIKPWKGW